MNSIGCPRETAQAGKRQVVTIRCSREANQSPLCLTAALIYRVRDSVGMG
jgi:hypothetical protein